MSDRPGPLNLITDVAGLSVGHATCLEAVTGTTVLLTERPMTAAVDLRGGAPGTRETDALDPTCLVGAADAIVLAGGSAFGLAAADAVVAWLAERGRGYRARGHAVPIVPAAILFDLANGMPPGTRPDYRALGLAAVEAARPGAFALGSVGAGTGAKAGALKGGLGSASWRIGAWTVGALVAANPIGSVVLSGLPQFRAWDLEWQDEFGGLPPPPRPVGAEPALPQTVPGANTTIGVVATDAPLAPAEARRLAIMAQDGLARAIRPVHTPFDGDTLFALAARPEAAAPVEPALLSALGAAAADCVARAIARAVHAADSLGAYRAWREVFNSRDW